MQHWYVYHSKDTMKHGYSSLGVSAIYSKKQQTKLCLNDIIWVVEGDENRPKNFTLVDCFRYTETEYPPFKGSYSGFMLRVLGKDSLLASPVRLNKTESWFSDLHARFITKQRFFNQVSDEPEIVRGLQSASGISF